MRIPTKERLRPARGRDQNRNVNEEPTVEELARARRRTAVRRMIVVIVVVAIIATLLVPVIVRVRAPDEPGGIIAAHAPIASRRMEP
jgi:cytochrome c-type biogenesis protein CcmH/NrfG